MASDVCKISLINKVHISVTATRGPSSQYSYMDRDGKQICRSITLKHTLGTIIVCLLYIGMFILATKLVDMSMLPKCVQVQCLCALIDILSKLNLKGGKKIP